MIRACDEIRTENNRTVQTTLLIIYITKSKKVFDHLVEVNKTLEGFCNCILFFYIFLPDMRLQLMKIIFRSSGYLYTEYHIE